MGIAKARIGLHQLAGDITDRIQGSAHCPERLIDYLGHAALASEVVDRGEGVDVLLSIDPTIWVEIRQDRMMLRGSAITDTYEHDVQVAQDVRLAVLVRHLP